MKRKGKLSSIPVLSTNNVPNSNRIVRNTASVPFKVNQDKAVYIIDRRPLRLTSLEDKEAKEILRERSEKIIEENVLTNDWYKEEYCKEEPKKPWYEYDKERRRDERRRKFQNIRVVHCEGEHGNSIVLQFYVKRWCARRMLNRLRKRRRKRSLIAHELWQTEKEYYDHLRVAESVFFRPLKEMCKKKEISDNTYSSLSHGYTGLSNISGVLVERLGRNCFPQGKFNHRSSVGKTMGLVTPFFKMYKTWVCQYQRANQTWYDLKRSGNKQIVAKIKKMEKDRRTTRLGLLSYFILPVSRVPRYRLILRDLLKNTEPENPDYKSIENTMERICEVADFLNNSIQELNYRDELLGIVEEFEKNGIPKNCPLLFPHRKLEKKVLGYIGADIRNENSLEKCLLVICNDCFFVGIGQKGKQYTSYKFFYLQKLQSVQVFRSKKHSNVLQIRNLDHGTVIAITLNSSEIVKDTARCILKNTIIHEKSLLKLKVKKFVSKYFDVKIVTRIY